MKISTLVKWLVKQLRPRARSSSASMRSAWLVGTERNLAHAESWCTQFSEGEFPKIRGLQNRPKFTMVPTIGPCRVSQRGTCNFWRPLYAFKAVPRSSESPSLGNVSEITQGSLSGTKEHSLVQVFGKNCSCAATLQGPDASLSV